MTCTSPFFLSHKYENLSEYSVVLIEQDTIDSSPQCPALIDVIGNIKVGLFYFTPSNGKIIIIIIIIIIIP